MAALKQFLANTVPATGANKLNKPNLRYVWRSRKHEVHEGNDSFARLALGTRETIALLPSTIIFLRIFKLVNSFVSSNLNSRRKDFHAKYSER